MEEKMTDTQLISGKGMNVHYRKQFTTSENDIRIFVDEGKTLQQIIDDLNIPEDLIHTLRVYIAGGLVPNKHFKNIKPKADNDVKILLIPEGDNEILRLVAVIAITYFAGAAGAAWAGAGTVGASVITIGITIAGMMALNAVFPPPEAAEVEVGGEGSSAALTIAGSRNQTRYDQSCPRIYGTVKVFPPYAAQPFTISHSGDQYLYMLFTLGYGDIDVTDLKIGETNIDDYTDITYNIIKNVSSSDDLSIFTNDIETEQVNIDLQLLNPVLRTSSIEQKYIQFDINFNAGLFGINAGGNNISEDVTFSYVLKDDIDTPIDPTDYFISPLTIPSELIISYPTTASFKIAGERQDGFSFTIRLSTTIVTDTVTLELTRSAASTNGVNTISNSYWTALRTFKKGAALGDFRVTDTSQVSHTMIEMQIKATDQLSGTIDALNCIATANLRTYTGGSPEFTAPIPTDNPAWILADVLTGIVNQRPKSDSKINWAELKRWADFCDVETLGQDGIYTKAHTCNFILDYSTTIYQLLKDITSVGRASLDVYDDKYSVIFEEEKNTKVQLFTNMNTNNFNSSRTYIELPDAVKINFRDPDSNWQMRELVVYNDGFVASNAKIYESINSPKTISSDEAYRNGRYWLKQAALRQEIIIFDTDIDWLECKRGSLIGFQHDVMKAGGTVARVRSVDGTNIIVDTIPDMNDNDVDQFELRPQTGTIISGFVAYYNIGDPYTVDLGIVGASIGDLIIFNSTGQQSYDLIVKEIDINPDQTARLTCLEYAPELFDLASLPIPTYIPHIGDINRPNATPVILESLEAIEELILINKLSYITITLNYQPAFGTVPSSYKIYKQLEDFTWEFQGSTTAVSFVWGKEILAIDSPIIGVQQIFSVVAVSSTNEYLDPSQGRQVTITPQGDITIPPTPDTFTVEDTAENFRRFWWGYETTTAPEDLAGFVIRYTRSSLQDWAAATPLHDGILVSPPFEIRALPQGAQTVMIRAVDTTGNYSTDSKKIIFTMGDRPVENVLFTHEFSAASPSWDGSIYEGNPVIDGNNRLSADTSTSGIMWNIISTIKMWNDDAALMWQTPNDSYKWITNITVPAAGISTIDWVGDGEVKLYYGTGIFPTDFTASNGSYVYSGSGQGIIPYTSPINLVSGDYFIIVDSAVSVDVNRLNTLTWTTDVPDINEWFDDVVVASTGDTTITLTKPFTQVTNVSIVLQSDGNNADSCRIISKTSSAIKVRCYSGTTTQVQGLIDIRIQGY